MLCLSVSVVTLFAFFAYNLSLSMFLFLNKHGVITTEEEQYLIEPFKNISSTTSSQWDQGEGQQHVIYKKSSIPSPQQQPNQHEFSCGISGW